MAVGGAAVLALGGALAVAVGYSACGGLNPEMTSKGIVALGGGTMPDGSIREALVLLNCQ